MHKKLFFFSATLLLLSSVDAQQKAKPEDTEVYTPVPKIVDPGTSSSPVPSDAVVLFDGTSDAKWVNGKDTTKASGWTVQNGVLKVNKQAGDIRTKESFNDYQLHLEWRVPEHITGKGQGRGNSGIYLASVFGGGYEIQILDNYNNTTYTNGQVGSIYKQHIPLANPVRPPGEWQVYDIVWTAPRFKADGSLASPARVTAFLNGVLVQNNVELKGRTEYIGQPTYKAHGAAPILLQSHGDPSEPISFRNIWLRPL
ncbi:MAG: DUF1080 domain-containing protein [Chitinophagaceae bacterium]|nr:MAG: DUF1080 domain-containing protein [Chitinophagaceae bacterium]